jgi:hypothetical protein
MQRIRNSSRLFFALFLRYSLVKVLGLAASPGLIPGVVYPCRHRPTTPALNPLRQNSLANRQATLPCRLTFAASSYQRLRYQS